MGSSLDLSVFWGVAIARLLLPLLIFKYPLPAILGCLVLDGIDESVFQAFTDLDLTNYQAYDKALDIYYLVIAYLSTMRNWRSNPAFLIGAALLYYRLAGVLAFNLTDSQYRFLLLVFPNTFEYFFIFYEAVRTRFVPERISARFWLLAAAVIWVFIKLPQEAWIHVAKLDFTDAVSDHPWFGALCLAALVAAAIVFWKWVHPRIPPADHDLKFDADPVPAALTTPSQRLPSSQRLFGFTLLEKVVLIALLTVLFETILPDLTASTAQIFVGSVVLIVVNSALGIHIARRGARYDSLIVSFVVLVTANLSLVFAVATVVRRGAPYDVEATVFFILLLTLMVVLYDRYRPVHEALTRQDPDVPRPVAAT